MNYLPSFLDELQKIAEASSERALLKKLRPGDILVTKPRFQLSLADKIIRAGLIAFQGTPYTHAAMYVGGGKVIDSSARKGEKDGVKLEGLGNFLERYDVKAYRVNAPKKVREDAAAYAKKQVGKSFNHLGMLRLALPVPEDVGSRERAKRPASLFCSELVANAYPSVTFRRRDTAHIRPVDLARSRNTREIARTEGSSDV